MPAASTRRHLVEAHHDVVTAMRVDLRRLLDQRFRAWAIE